MKYEYFPKTNTELRQLVDSEIDVAIIDVKDIEDFSYVFYKRNPNNMIAHWNTSKGKKFDYMFFGSDFNGTINQWDISNGETFKFMFALSKYNQNVETWSMLKAIDISYMFFKSKLNKNINNWKLPNLKRAVGVFSESNYSFGVRDWDLNFDCDITMITDSEEDLNSIQKFMIKRNKFDALELENIKIMNSNQDAIIIKYLDIKNNRVALRKKYSYLLCDYELNIPDDVLEEINSKEYLSHYIAQDDDFYYFRYISGDYATEEEAETIQNLTFEQFPRILFKSAIPAPDETNNYIKQGTSVILVDLEFVLRNYVKVTYKGNI